MKKDMKKNQEKEPRWDKVVCRSTLQAIKESLSRSENIVRSLRALSTSLTAEILSVENLLESLANQLNQIEVGK